MAKVTGGKVLWDGRTSKASKSAADSALKAQDRAFGEHVTTSTLVYLSKLAAPQYLVEIDAWAAR
jgi:hypothetical protein